MNSPFASWENNSKMELLTHPVDFVQHLPSVPPKLVLVPGAKSLFYMQISVCCIENTFLIPLRAVYFSCLHCVGKEIVRCMVCRQQQGMDPTSISRINSIWIAGLRSSAGVNWHHFIDSDGAKLLWPVEFLAPVWVEVKSLSDSTTIMFK